MVERISWSKFRDDGFLWLTNMILHLFGIALVYEFEKDGQLICVYPARVSFRGFSEKNNSEGYKKVSQYMTDNANKLLEEVEEK